MEMICRNHGRVITYGKEESGFPRVFQHFISFKKTHRALKLVFKILIPIKSEYLGS